MSDKIPAMERVVEKVDKLHSSPHVACKALSVLRRNDFDIRELTELLEADPALTASILRLVNSSYYGMSHDVSSLRQAVTLLGSRALRLAVLSFGLLKQLNDDTPARICERYWKTSLTMAAAANRLTGFDGGVADDVAYSAGLLSDVGVLVFAQVRTDDYISVYEQHHQSATLVCEEEELFGFNHCDLGAYMLGKWNLPEDLCRAVVHHHGAPLTLSRLDFVVATSNLLAAALWTPDSASVVTAQQLLHESFALDVDGFIELATSIQQSVHETSELFSVTIDGAIDCDALLETARRTYVDVASEPA